MKYTITRRLEPEKYPWLPRAIEAGESMFYYSGCTYGCVGWSGIALTFDPLGGPPFLEIPNDAVTNQSEPAQ